MVSYRYQNKKAFPVERISSQRHTFFTINIIAALLTQTLARSGSTKTGPFHDLCRCPAHEEGPPNYEAKAGNEHTALLQLG